MTAAPDPAFEPVLYVVDQKRLRRLARTGMRRSYGRIFWFIWAWLAFYFGLLAMMALFPRPYDNAARALGHALGWQTDTVMTLAFVLVMAVFVSGFLVLRRLFGRALAQRINFENALELRPLAGGVAIVSPTIDYHLRWPGIHQLLIEPDGLALAHGGLFFFVPSAAFTSPKHYQDVIAHVIANLTPEAAARSQKDIDRAQAE